MEGDLSVQGGAEFYGPVIVKGSLKTAGTGGHFNGGVLAANVDLEQSSFLGNGVVNFSGLRAHEGARRHGDADVRRTSFVDGAVLGARR